MSTLTPIRRVSFTVTTLVLAAGLLAAPAMATETERGATGWLLWLLGLREAASRQSQQPKLDLNAATPQELAALPGMDGATAHVVVAGRPYASVGELSRVGLSAETIKRIAPLVEVKSSDAVKRHFNHRTPAGPGRWRASVSTVIDN